MKFGNSLIFNVPGLHNSGPDHWQSHWEKSFENIYRIEQNDWDHPEKDEWVATIDTTLKIYDHSKVVLIGHSVGCMAIVHWLNAYKAKIRGTLLVAPSDVEHENYPSYINGFDPIPLTKLACPSIVVASSNDHVVSPERATYFG